MSQRSTWAIVLYCVVAVCTAGSAKVELLSKTTSPNLMNSSFEAQGEAGDRAASWGRWGDWLNRETQWTPVRTGKCILGYHHWEVPNANDSGVYQDVVGAVPAKECTFGIYANPDKAKDPAKDALTVELRLESTVEGKQRTVASKLYKVADMTADQWEKLTVSGAPANDTFRVLVIVTPSRDDKTRGGALRFDDAFLDPSN